MIVTPTGFFLRSKPLRRIALGSNQCSPINQAGLVVQLQQLNRCAPSRSQADYLFATQFEMIAPLLLAWIEEPNNFSGYRIKSHEIGTFVTIAKLAGQGQVIAPGLPSVFDGDQVVNLMRRLGVILMQQTIFAATTRASDHKITQSYGNIDARHNRLRRSYVAAIRARALRRIIEW